MKLKKYRVECTQRYLDGCTETETLTVWAYDSEHAEEKAWDSLGGARGEVSNMTFRAFRAK